MLKGIAILASIYAFTLILGFLIRSCEIRNPSKPVGYCSEDDQCATGWSCVNNKCIKDD